MQLFIFDSRGLYTISRIQSNCAVDTKNIAENNSKSANHISVMHRTYAEMCDLSHIALLNLVALASSSSKRITALNPFEWNALNACSNWWLQRLNLSEQQRNKIYVNDGVKTFKFLKRFIYNTICTYIGNFFLVCIVAAINSIGCMCMSVRELVDNTAAGERFLMCVLDQHTHTHG